MAASASLKDYLKRYESNNPELKDKKKKKKKKKKPSTEATGVLIVDEDPVWQKPVILAEEEDNESPDEMPQVDEDIEVKRMKRLEQLRAKRPYHAISEDGSGWVSVSDFGDHSDTVELNRPSSSRDTVDLSPPRQHRRRYDSESPEPPLDAKDLSPPRMQRRNGLVSPTRKLRPADSPGDADLSPPQQRRRRRESESAVPGQMPLDDGKEAATSPPSRPRRRYDSPDPDQSVDMSPPRRPQRKKTAATSPPSRPRRRYDSPDPDQSVDMSPPRRPQREKTADPENHNESDLRDLSPPRRERQGSPIMSKSRGSVQIDLSPPRKTKERGKTGLITGQDIKEEILRKKHEELSKFKLMDPSVTGQAAATIYRDRKKGVRISEDEYKKSQKKEEKPKEEKKLEWGKGLAQKRETEAKLLELEVEKDKPFARSRDDPDLDRMLKDAVRWGDPMAHLVKRKQSGPVLPDLGDDEKMKESGFIIPQEIPGHSWIKRGAEAAPNRYGIKPGRHWDGVDRSNGYEKELFKRTNEKRATEREAYLWSVSDM